MHLFRPILINFGRKINMLDEKYILTFSLFTFTRQDKLRFVKNVVFR